MKKLQALLREESGSTATEYALLAALVSLAILTGLLLLNTALPGLFWRVANSVNNAAPSP